jgi:Fic family protein
MSNYLYEEDGWPVFSWDSGMVLPYLARVRNLQGRVLGRAEALGFDLRQRAALEVLSLNAVKSSEIEGIRLSRPTVRSSIARRLGIETGGVPASDHAVEGVVDMMFDATHKFSEPLTEERLFGWHAALFPYGVSGPYTIDVAKYRRGGVQVVSGGMGYEKVHYQAPDAGRVKKEMDALLNWIDGAKGVESVIKAAVAHLWFVTIHPFDDGNGRIARAIADMLLARADDSPLRFYSMSSGIQKERKRYYDILELTQSAGLDITRWLVWFMECLERSLNDSFLVIANVLRRSEFWTSHSSDAVNERQRLMLNKLLDGFKGRLRTAKWAQLAKCSHDTALRDIQDLIAKGILEPEPAGGRSTAYRLKP